MLLVMGARLALQLLELKILQKLLKIDARLNMLQNL